MLEKTPQKQSINALFSAQFVAQADLLVPLKQLLYHDAESRHIVCIGEHQQYDWQDLRRTCSWMIQRLQTETSEQSAVALVFKSGFLMVCALLACVHLKRKIILPSLATVEHLHSIAAHFSLLMSDELKLQAYCHPAKGHQAQQYQAQQYQTQEYSDKSAVLFCSEIAESGQPIEFSEAFIGSEFCAPDSADILLFTSGSTGQPKGIEKYLALFDRQIRIEHQLLKAQLQGCVMYSTVNHNHLLGLMYRLLFPLVLRMPFFEYNFVIPEQVAKIPFAYALISSPAFLRFLDPRLSYPPANIVFSSGGKLPEPVGLLTQSLLQTELMEFYGSSETGAVAYRTFPQQQWLVLDGIEFKQDLQDNCLTIRSPLLPSGEWYKMEDRIALQKNSFELLGRADRVAKISDKRISLTQIENLALQLEEIKEVKALVVSDHLRDSVGLVVVLNDGHQDQSRKAILLRLRQHLKNHIELIALPRKVRLQPFMPMNEQGKLSLSLLQELFNE
ncbi:AMP-binding protein [Testudinibacter sp. TR-2022]|uniref:AMP-binding protein n=1 Tax=Testudinibacter sp. TR-2022 TaxID=2585029 RepID=UPI001118A005|nr:AMP-binding protein [Testudinibacter sp. TR-2022]TNH06000.1 acyl-CoA synthetase [Pasteurellaceae bacterium Phil11]TNH24299.1 acyl-CoA synthetase [Testudinibacter sp. TR-2022]TNH26890.1 acyl-CoA synthetase [Testudinibacter sp. TR-2022]